jgi:outer membrane protein OmpA-like peptidoglycan-associated protein
VSKSGRITKWIGALAICSMAPACSFQASMSAGAKSPEEPPPTEPVPTEPPGGEPEPAQPAKPKANVKVNGAKLQVPGELAFQPDSAVFAEGAGNEAVLAELKAYLEQSPRVTRLRIEGHTNNTRPADQSLQLSGQRALAVKNWLRQNGINEGRLLAVGFGDGQPVASNADAAGQAQNERIAFRIAELDGKPYLGADPLAGGTEFP